MSFTRLECLHCTAEMIDIIAPNCDVLSLVCVSFSTKYGKEFPTCLGQMSQLSPYNRVNRGTVRCSHTRNVIDM